MLPFFEVTRHVRSSPLFRWGAAAVLFAAAVAVRFAVDGALPPGFPFLTFFPAVIVTAYVAGSAPGAAVAVASALAAWYWFIPPIGALQLDPATLVALTFFAVVARLDILLIHLASVAYDRLRSEQARTAQLYEQHRTLFQELQHRVANNMAFIAGLLSLYKRRVAKREMDPGAALDDAQARLQTIARIHRRLYDPASVALPIGRYLKELCEDILEASAARNIVCLVDAQEIRLDIQQLLTLSLIVSETLTNSLKHAYDGRAGGTISLQVERLSPEQVTLTIRDDGRGFADLETARAESLGVRIIQSLAGQLAGEVEHLNDGGAVTRIRFAA
ncbi:MAG TPA: histidine kinase dimerization/phosphoacceptor domain -containing protein [Beijerinckiaceae bacterium]|jgi:two-component sensor histidine kinase